MLLEFHGSESARSLKVLALIERLEREEGIKIKLHEVWHNEENAKKLESFDVGLCGIVPFLINSEDGTFLCGEVTYEELKRWAIKARLQSRRKVRI